jgi:pimeloyl-ACP methyl ester carboxylesterase
MTSAAANGITIEYATTGNPDHPPLLLIMGLGAQLIAWDDEFVEALGQRGFYVIRYDNRDVGRSTWFDEAGVPDMASLVAADAPQPAYLVSDMADDAAGLLAALGIPSAHVLGASMGGMIAQSFALQYPEWTRSLVSIMSSTGVPQTHPEVLEALTADPPTDRAGVIDQSVKAWGLIGSPGFPMHEERIRAKAAAAYDRAFHPEGTARQTVAILASPDRAPALAKVEVPTLVIHGESDRLVDPSGGRATAAAIPGAELWTIPGMGHDLPPELFDQVADRVAALARNPTS